MKVFILSLFVATVAVAAPPYQVFSVADVATNAFSLKGKVIGMSYRRVPEMKEVEPGVYEVAFWGSGGRVLATAAQDKAMALKGTIGVVYVRMIEPTDSAIDSRVEILGNALKSNNSQLRPETTIIWKK